MRTVRYVGGLTVDVELPTGRVVELKHRDTLEVLPAEYKVLIARTDFELVETAEPKEKAK